MLYLAVETSQINGSICLIENKNVLATERWSRSGSHSELLTHATEKILNAHQLQLSELATVAVGLGPGSFTGIRVAVNFARSFGFLTKKKIFALPSTELLATQILNLNNRQLDRIHVLQYGFRDLIYYASYETSGAYLKCVAPLGAATLADLAKYIREPGYVVGTALAAFPEELLPLLPDQCLVDPRLSNEVDAEMFLQTLVLDAANTSYLSWNQVVPLYIRASEAEEKLRRGALSTS